MNSPNNAAVLRSLIIYAVCVVLAIWLGFLLTGPLTYSTLAIYGFLAFVLIFPLLLRWHYPLLLLSWNMSAIVFFLPGQPSLCLLMIVLSLGISVFQRMISKESQFINVPQLIWPLLCLVAVVAVTAKLTGLGLRTFGGEVYGGKKYVYLLGGILGYFALSAHRIPIERKNLCIGLFFLGGIMAFIGDLIPIMPHSLYFIYWVFNVNQYAFRPEGFGGDTMRLTGAVTVATAVLSYMLARYGIKGILLFHKPLRWLTFLLFSVYGLFGGFRGFIVTFALLLTIQFFLEGLHRTKLILILLFAGILGGLALIPLAPHLPYTFQRTLSFLPLQVDPLARQDAQGSLDWRVQMWKALLPQVPRYLLLGKGLAITPDDYEMMGRNSPFQAVDPSQQGAALAFDYHNGPLSVIIPFGIWGCLAFLWFLAAGIRVLYTNYRYSDPALQTVNRFLFAAFVTQTIYFLLFFGDFSSGMLGFTGTLGLSVSLNGGVRRPFRTMPSKPQFEKIQNPTDMRPSSLPVPQQ
jgi:hypothetical protein